MKEILIFIFDINKYPPILSLINVLLKNNREVIVFGHSSNPKVFEHLPSDKFTFFDFIESNNSNSSLYKIYQLYSFKRKVKESLKKYTDISRLWLLGGETTWVFHDLIKKYDTIGYLFEMPEFQVPLKYRVSFPSIKYLDNMNSFKHIICCEYHRALITKSYFGLPNMPIVLPNKPEISIENSEYQIPEDLLNLMNRHKVILYQGIFNFPERRLEELCQSIEFLPEEYVIFIMGGEDEAKNNLRKKYESNRVYFLPFLSPPDHLKITEKSYIGYLSYFSISGNIGNTLNTLFCAPNKIYEYAKYGKPMIANDVPALSYSFNKYKSGISVKEFTPWNLALAIQEISSDYKQFQDGAYELYNSVDINSIIKDNIIDSDV